MKNNWGITRKKVKILNKLEKLIGKSIGLTSSRAIKYPLQWAYGIL